MTPLPAALDPATAAELVVWRLDDARHADSWDSGIGAERVGGRWNPKGLRAVYCSIDPATCLVEAAVHRGFDALDTRPHVLSSLTVSAPVRIVLPEEVPNPAWLHSGIPSAGQQRWGAALLLRHGFVVLPSVASRLSWNLVFMPSAASGRYTLRSRSRLVLDTRLNPPGLREHD
jgi:RES domain-containing protein